MCNLPEGSIGVMYGNGDGTFQDPASAVPIYETRTISLWDLEGDGDLDMVVRNNTGASVFLQTAPGQFRACDAYNADPYVLQSIAMTDVGADGYVDALVGHYYGITFFRGEAGSSFGDRTEIPIPGGATAMAAGDFNKDGYSDVAVVSFGDTPVTVFFGDSTGALANPSALTHTDMATDIKTADFNGDGQLDLVFNKPYESSIAFYLGKGGGQFAEERKVPVSQGPLYLTTGDYDGDHRSDVAVAYDSKLFVTVLFGDAYDGPGATSEFPLTSVGLAITSGDANADGYDDILVERAGEPGGPGGYSEVYPGNPDRLFTMLDPSTSHGRATSIMLADVTGNGALDLIVTPFGRTYANDIGVFPGLGNGTFGSPYVFATSGQVVNFTSADVNKDGFLDIGINDSRNLTVLQSNPVPLATR
jgi:hypothetical protein